MIDSKGDVIVVHFSYPARKREGVWRQNDFESIDVNLYEPWWSINQEENVYDDYDFFNKERYNV